MARGGFSTKHCQFCFRVLIWLAAEVPYLLKWELEPHLHNWGEGKFIIRSSNTSVHFGSICTEQKWPQRPNDRSRQRVVAHFPTFQLLAGSAVFRFMKIVYGASCAHTYRHRKEVSRCSTGLGAVVSTRFHRIYGVWWTQKSEFSSGLGSCGKLTTWQRTKVFWVILLPKSLLCIHPMESWWGANSSVVMSSLLSSSKAEDGSDHAPL